MVESDWWLAGFGVSLCMILLTGWGLGRLIFVVIIIEMVAPFPFPNATFFSMGRVLGVGGKFGVFFCSEWGIDLVKGGVLGVWTLK